MDESITLTAAPRSITGKRVRALRAVGTVPIHMYGLKKDSLALQAELTNLRTALRAAGFTTPVTVKVADGEETVTLVREIQRHAVSGDIQHVDFMRVDVQQEIEAPVPIVLIGQEEAPGTAGGAGVVTQGEYEITVRALPFDVPSEIVVDCSILETLDQFITSGDLKLPPGVELAGADDIHIAWIQPPRVTAEEDEVTDELLEGEEVEAAEGEEGEAAPAEEGGEGETESQ